MKQQVCDYLVVTLIEDFLHARIGFHQASSTKGKGSLFAAKQLRRWAHEGGYYVQVDVRQCYPSISHDLVMRILRKHIRSWDILYVAETLLATYGKGLDIGSYFSLRMAQLVLSYPYHHVASLGKTRRGKHMPLVSQQIWYLDDAVLMSQSKSDLLAATRSLERYLRTELGLTLKPWKISRVGDQEPIDLAGYLIRPDRTTIRDRTFLRATRSVHAFQKQPTLSRARTVCSYWGWFIHSDSRKAIARHQIDRAFHEARNIISEHERTRNAHNSNPQRDPAGASHARARTGGHNARMAPKKHHPNHTTV